MIFPGIIILIWLVEDVRVQDINVTITGGLTRCSTNTSKPMFFKDINYTEFQKFNPKIQENQDYPFVYYRCDLGDDDKCDAWWRLSGWTRRNSIDYNNNIKGTIVIDERWQEFKLFHLEDKGNNSGMFTELLSNLDLNEDFVIPISWKIPGDLDLYLCSTETAKTFDCYCIELRDNNTLVNLKECSGLTLPKLDFGSLMEHCLQNEKETNPLKWNGDTWHNSFLAKIHGSINLYHTRIREYKRFRFNSAIVQNFRNIKYLFAHSIKEGFLKIHHYNYLQTETIGSFSIGRPFRMTYGSICLALYVSMCHDCSMVFMMAGRPTGIIRRNKTITWSYIQISIFNSVNEYEQLYVETIRETSQNGESAFWAIDFVQLCPDERSISLPGNHTCEYVNPHLTIVPEFHIIDILRGPQVSSNAYLIECSFPPAGNVVDVWYPVTPNGVASYIEFIFIKAGQDNHSVKMSKVKVNVSETDQISDSIRFATAIPFKYILCEAYFLQVQPVDDNFKISGPAATIMLTPELFPDNLIFEVTDQSDHSVDFTVANYSNHCQDDRSLSVYFKRYLLVLIPDNYKTSKDYEQIEFLKKTLNVKFDKSDRVVAEFNLNQFTNDTIFKFTIGDGKEIYSSNLRGVLRNSPLESSSTYKFKFLIVTLFDKNQNYFFYHHTGSTKEAIRWMGDPWLIASIILIIFGIILGISWYLYNRRKKSRGISVLNKKPHNTDNVSFLSDVNQSGACLVTSKSEDREMASISGIAISLPRSHPKNANKKLEARPIKNSKFEKYIRSSIKTQELEQQFNSLPQGMTKPCDYGLLDVNQPKNRNNNILPYDDTRVELAKGNKMQNSDYINANYIRGYENQRAYIATQGPRALTINDFWQMVWQENVHNIIMLVNLEESGQKKVEKYWPNYNQDFQFGKVHVFYHAAEVLADYEIRVFKVVRDETERKVFQYHFLRWPDQGVPVHFQTLVPFMRKTLEISSNSPIVVHCCSGTSATGVFILCHINLKRAAETGTVDPFGVAQELRKQRMNMIDNLQQYKLAHLVIMECILGLHTAISCTDDINRLVAELTSPDELKLQMAYLNEADWQNRVLIRPTEPIEAFEVFPKKNRRMDISPDCIGAVNLSRYPSTDPSSAYINAVKVDGYRCPERYIVTQQPMPNTLSDFWRMVVQDNIQAIISLNDINLKDKKSCSFWPTEENPEMTPVDFINLKHSVTDNQENFNRTIIHVSVNGNQGLSTKVNILSLNGWNGSDVVPFDARSFLKFYCFADSISRQFPLTVVTCYDGANASGLYVATSYLIEKIKLEKAFDVCEAVKIVRRNRKQFISQEVQLAFLYEIAMTYIKDLQGYENFSTPLPASNIYHYID